MAGTGKGILQDRAWTRKGADMGVFLAILILFVVIVAVIVAVSTISSVSGVIAEEEDEE